MVDPINRRSVVDEIADRIRRQILEGAIRPGDRLPAERDIALEMGVNRLTLRQAFARLAAQGLIRVRQGDGTRATDFRRHGTLEVLLDLLGSVRGSPRVLTVARDVLELRRNAAADVSALAAERGTTDDFDAIGRSVDALASLLARAAPRRDVERAEVEISRAVVRASGNLAYELLLNTVHRLSEALPSIDHLAPIPPDLLVAGYRSLLALLRARDADGAHRATVEATRVFDDALLEHLRATAGGRES